MSLTRTRLRVAVCVMRYYNSVPLTGAMPVMAPLGAVQTTNLLVVMIHGSHLKISLGSWDKINSSVSLAFRVFIEFFFQ